MIDWKRLYMWAAGSIVVLNVVDAITTIKALNSGLAQEANPLMASIVGYDVPFLIFKVLVSIGFVIMLFRFDRQLTPQYIAKHKTTVVLGGVIAVIVALGYALVQYNNLRFFL